MRVVAIAAVLLLGGAPKLGSGADGGTTIPPAATLNFSCRSQNIGVLATDDPDFSLACSAGAIDAQGLPIIDADIRFIEEAGVLLKTDDGIEGSTSYTYFPRQGARSLPKHPVAPFPGEPFITVNGETRNPRNMLATLVAFVPGDNPQIGDMFSGDPFVDMDDDQVRDDDEPFISADGSGVYSTSQTTLLWKQFKVVWTGRLSQIPTIVKCEAVGGTGSTKDIPNGQIGTFQFTLLDDFFNVLAVNAATDQIYWETDSPWLDINNGQDATPFGGRGRPGLDIDKDGNFPSHTTEGSFRRDSKIGVTARNTLPSGYPSEAYTIGGIIERSLTVDELGASGYILGDEELPKCSGMLQ